MDVAFLMQPSVIVIIKRVNKKKTRDEEQLPEVNKLFND